MRTISIIPLKSNIQRVDLWKDPNKGLTRHSSPLTFKATVITVCETSLSNSELLVPHNSVCVVSKQYKSVAMRQLYFTSVCNVTNRELCSAAHKRIQVNKHIFQEHRAKKIVFQNSEFFMPAVGNVFTEIPSFTYENRVKYINNVFHTLLQ